MKLLLLSLLAFCSLIQVQAQNWRPVQPGYVYQYDDKEMKYFNQNTGINHLRVLSKGIENGDSVYNLNPVSLKVSPTAKDVVNRYLHRCGMFIIDPGIVIRNQPYFLGKKVRISSDDWIFDEKFTIRPQAALGDKWSFYTSSDSTVQAEVTQIQRETFLNVTDDVKTISLSTGDTIKLSKHHGIIWFPYFNEKHTGHQLLGVDGPNTGIVIPMAKKIYDFSPGDIYQYKHNDNNLNYVGEYVRQVIIQQRMESASDISYKVREITLKDGKVSIATRNLYYSLTNPELSMYPDEFSENYQNGIPFKTEGNKRQKNTSMGSYDYFKWEQTSNGSDTLIPARIYYSCPSATVSNYVIGLGNTYYSEDGMGGKWEMMLTAYRKTDGRNGGTIMQIDTTTGVETIAYNAPRLRVYPNPANGETMTVSGNLSRPGVLQFTLTDLQGRTITTTPAIEVPTGEFRQNIDISQVSAGIYLLKVTGVGISESLRVSVVR